MFHSASEVGMTDQGVNYIPQSAGWSCGKDEDTYMLHVEIAPKIMIGEVMDMVRKAPNPITWREMCTVYNCLVPDVLPKHHVQNVH